MLPGNQDVDDILQDTNVILWEKRKKYNWEMDFKPWASGIARNKVRQYWASHKHDSCINLDEDFLDAVAQAHQHNSVDKFAQKREALAQCMALLKSRDRDLIHAYSYNQESLDSRLKKFGLTAASLRVTTHRIRKKLRLCIEKRLAWEGASK